MASGSEMITDKLDGNDGNDENTTCAMCLMCLEAPVVGDMGACPHSYCKTCLLKHIESQLKSSASGEAFPCPACRVAPSQVKKFVSDELSKIDDVLSVIGAENGLGLEGHGESATSLAKMDSGVEVDVDNCAVCEFKNKELKAVKVCMECSSLKLCGECASDHAVDEFTKNHFVASLKMHQDMLCDAHKKLLKCFCNDCDKPVCHICIMLDHKEHSIRSLAEEYRQVTSDVKTSLAKEEVRLEHLLNDEKELRESKNAAVLMEGTLIRKIEDQAEECIQKILKKKEDLKKQVKKDFGVVGVLEGNLEAMPNLIKKSKDTIAQAKKLLAEAELHPKCVMELMGVHTTMEDLETPGYQEDCDSWKRKYKQLCEKSPTFYPKHQKLDIGGFEKPDPRKPAEICASQGFCTCSICESKVKKPNPGNAEACRAKGICKCGSCGRGLCWSDPKKGHLCLSRGCTCVTCGLSYERADSSKFRVCRARGTCVCGTCERTYDRKKLPGGQCMACGTTVTVDKNLKTL